MKKPNPFAAMKAGAPKPFGKSAKPFGKPAANAKAAPNAAPKMFGKSKPKKG